MLLVKMGSKVLRQYSPGQPLAVTERNICCAMKYSWK